MTIAGRLAAIFPALHLAAMLAAFYDLLREPSIVKVVTFGSVVYLVPLIIFRIHNLAFPLKDEIVDIAKKAYNPWWTTHCLQLSYVAMPILESPLHLVPGAFSVWLRLWGSRIGRRVYWTPRVEIVDRGLLDIGDDVVVGHFAVFCSHAITPRQGQLSLIVRRILVGEKAFVGAESRLGPGAVLPAGETLKVRSVLYWRSRPE